MTPAMTRIFTLTLFFLLCAATTGAQDTLKPLVVTTGVLNGDTLPLLDISPSVVFPQGTPQVARQAVRFDRLVYNVKKVYPYARMAGVKLKEYESILDTIPGEKARKAFMKKAQEELESQFGNEIRDLTISQGKILIKLIYRETGHSSYDLVRELRGGFVAFLAQTMASLFGYNLRTRYDPQGEDQVIEHIVQKIESGEL